MHTWHPSGDAEAFQAGGWISGLSRRRQPQPLGWFQRGIQSNPYFGGGDGGAVQPSCKGVKSLRGQMPDAYIFGQVVWLPWASVPSPVKWVNAGTLPGAGF